MIDNDTYVDAFLARADADFAARRMSEAARNYRLVLAVSPRNTHALHRMALTSVHLEDLEQACHFIERALHATPDQAVLWEHAGLLAGLQGRHDSAEAFYRRATLLTDTSASLHRNLGDCLRFVGRYGEAIDHYAKSLEIEPGSHHAVRSLARIHTHLCNTDEALEFWLRSWVLQPDASQEDMNQMVSIIESGHANLVSETVEQITIRSAGDPAALKAVAHVLNVTHRYRDALVVALQGLAIDALDLVFRHQVAYALRRLGRVEDSRAYSQEVARALPHDPKMQFHYAGVLLCLGEFEEGWKLYKSFYDVPENKAFLHWPNFPLWNGESVAGRQFLLVGEQGFGDQIQFLRCAEWLNSQGAIVDVLVDGAIAGLAASMRSIRRVFTSMPPGPYDFWTHMLRMPEYMKLDLGMLPVAMPYLAANPQKASKWRAHIEARSPFPLTVQKKCVGIVWAGDARLSVDRFRSIQIDAFRTLFSLPEISWYSVQKGEREREGEALEREFDMHTLGPLIQGFGDTLAILKSLDLLITVDSSVAHLAGAAGLPVWTLIPAYTDWRWMTDRTDSPWYPSMRLFRQRELGEWADVIDEVRDALEVWCSTGGI